MSKFFKALEQAEQDRARQQATAPTPNEVPAPSPESPVVVTERPISGVEPEKDGKKRSGRSVSAPELEEARGQAAARAETSRRNERPARIRVAARVEPPLRTEQAYPKESVDHRPEAPPKPLETDQIDEHLVSLATPSSFAAEEYRRVRLAIEQRTGLQVVAVTSTEAGEGKTTTAINLAGSLAQSASNNVLLIEADLRHPSMADRLGLDPSRMRGLVDFIQDPSLSLEGMVHRLSRFNLSVLPAGRPAANEYELLRSSRFTDLLDEARRRYQFVILDVPPLLPVPDCRVIGDAVDGFIVVIAAHRTTRKLLAETLAMLKPETVLGLVLNRDDQWSSGRQYYPNAFTSNASREAGAHGWLGRALRGWSRRG
jgi:capsular exopolysaccharide synthesis family protein